MDYIHLYDSPIGPLILRSDGLSLTGLSPALSGTVCDDLPVFQTARDWLDAYFQGHHPDPALLPLDPRGTPFQKAVWAQLLTIPYGASRTYGDIASAVGRPRGAQAVGQAVGRNPIGIMIPCHRILGSGGCLTGFAWGIDKKKWLLRHEGVKFLDHQ